MSTSRSHRSTLAGIVACAIAYVFVLQATLAATLTARLPNAALLTGELCLSHPDEPNAAGTDGIDPNHVKAASRCSLCVVPGFGLLLPPPAPNVVVIRAALGITFEASVPDRIDLAEAPSPHRARAPPLSA